MCVDEDNKAKRRERIPTYVTDEGDEVRRSIRTIYPIGNFRLTKIRFTVYCTMETSKDNIIQRRVRRVEKSIERLLKEGAYINKNKIFDKSRRLRKLQITLAAKQHDQAQTATVPY